jgi:hypothetical protein
VDFTEWIKLHLGQEKYEALKARANEDRSGLQKYGLD